MIDDTNEATSPDAPHVVALDHPSLDRLLEAFCEALAARGDGSTGVSEALRDIRAVRLGLVTEQQLAAVVCIRFDGVATFARVSRRHDTNADERLLTTSIRRFHSITGRTPTFLDEQLDRGHVRLAVAHGARVSARRGTASLVPV